MKENDEVPVIDSIKEEIVVEPDKTETKPVFSTKEDTEAFNAWYYQKLAENKMPKKSKSALNSPNTEVMKSSSSTQVVTETSPTMWKVDMNVVIVVMIALLSCLSGGCRTKLVPARETVNTSVTNYSYPECVTCLCGVPGMNTGQSQVSNHGNSVKKRKLYVWLSAVWLWIKGTLLRRGEM